MSAAMQLEKKRELIDKKSDEIIAALLGKHCMLCNCISDDFAETDYSLRRLKIMHYELKQQFKEKEKEQLKMIGKHKEKQDLEESLQNKEELSKSSASPMLSEYQLLH